MPNLPDGFTVLDVAPRAVIRPTEATKSLLTRRPTRNRREMGVTGLRPGKKIEIPKAQVTSFATRVVPRVV